MNNQISQIFANSLKTLFVTVIKLLAIGFSLFTKACGVLLTKIGEITERVILKKSQ